MAQPHDVECPECKGTFSTKAQRGIRIKCRHCGHSFRAPDVPSAGTTPATDATTTTPPAEPEAVNAGGVRVVHADAVKIKRNARPAKPADSAAETVTPAPSNGPAGSDKSGGSDGGRTDPPPRPPDQEKFRKAGRRGGTSFYKEHFRHAR